jgi:hypothetical protein
MESPYGNVFKCNCLLNSVDSRPIYGVRPAQPGPFAGTIFISTNSTNLDPYSKATEGELEVVRICRNQLTQMMQNRLHEQCDDGVLTCLPVVPAKSVFAVSRGLALSIRMVLEWQIGSLVSY